MPETFNLDDGLVLARPTLLLLSIVNVLLPTSLADLSCSRHYFRGLFLLCLFIGSSIKLDIGQ